MIKRTIFILIFLPYWIISHSQSLIGSWRSHLPYSEAYRVTVAGDKIYCSTSGGLFYFNVKDNTINKVSKEDGLSGTRITAMQYSSSAQTLVLAYETSNIDIIQDNRIYTLPDIERKQFPGDKTIYNIVFNGDLAYLSTGFGIVVLDVLRREFPENYGIVEGGSGIKVNETVFFENYIYAATDKGIFRAQNDGSINLLDFASWQLVTSIPGFNRSFSTITSRNGKIYVAGKGLPGENDVVYEGDGVNWAVYPNFSGDICKRLAVSGDDLIVVERYSVYVYDINEVQRKHFFTGLPMDAVTDEKGDLWIADETRGLLRNQDEYTLHEIAPEGPASTLVSDIQISDNKVFVVPGGAKSNQENLYRNGEVYRFINNSWINWSNPQIRDFYRIAADPRDSEHYYVASWGYGLHEFNGSELEKTYNISNSTLQTTIPGDYVRLGGLAFDKDYNLWITNSDVGNLVSVLTDNGEWTGFPVRSMFPEQFIYLGRIIVTRNNHKWIIVSRSNGLFILDDNGTISEHNDDRYKRLSVVDENNSVITNNVRSIAEDHDGNIWLGTNKGILVYYNPGRVFDEGLFYAQPIIIPRKDGSIFGDPLLGTETVTAIAVDGANRKWLGTASAGVFLVSSDGMKEIHSFNTGNSPVLSDNIIDIAINDRTGEVYIATDKGLISYKSDAISPGSVFSDVYVYPNPVRHDYFGDIVITGLVAETLLKITDISGNLVYETKSLGGQAIWDGNNFRGERVRTGVYLVFGSDKDGVMSMVTKLLFIN